MQNILSNNINQNAISKIQIDVRTDVKLTHNEGKGNGKDKGKG